MEIMTGSPVRHLEPVYHGTESLEFVLEMDGLNDCVLIGKGVKVIESVQVGL